MPPNIALSTRTAFALASLFSVAAPTAYLLILKASVARHVTSSFGQGLPRLLPSAEESASSKASQPSGSAARRPHSLPADVSQEDSSDFVVSHERAISHPIPLSSLNPELSLEEMVTVYVRAAMEAFSWTPQAFAIRALICSPEAKRTYDKSWMQALNFEEGDVVNGAYRVAYRGDNGLVGSERIEFALDPPASYRGPVVHGLVVSGVERSEESGSVIFVNETWLWRRREENPVLLENRFGRWMHSLLAGWLIMRGLKAVTKGGRAKAE